MVSDHPGGEGMVGKCASQHGNQEEKREKCLCSLAFPFIHLVPQPMSALLLLVNFLWKHPNRHILRFCFTNLLGVSQSNQVDNQQLSVNFVTPSSYTDEMYFDSILCHFLFLFPLPSPIKQSH
jgi:hypothetical protein